ncbi:M20/M25/M40 family metallo-hydrolase [Agromyces sp. Marseille-P2726]|uniref:M20/M25/M40 family metallo-hydrolase n=1 Tax=Agromyces sp. Marseille-P2726 TaxID=2709132 RepID=UPI00156E99BC|nr:M20/M25/M40 family metallo-hydrolase [Agromyces sp. Marseille-P2726]
MTEVRAFLDASESDVERDLLEWVRIPSISGDDEHRAALSRSAEYLAVLFRTAGFPRVETWQQGDGLAVFAEWPADPAAPTVLVYSHHDVRTPEGEEWTECEPFLPVVRDGVMFGRGASDAKGQVLTHLWAVRAHVGAGERTAPDVNLKFLVEAEEELGSPHLRELLDEHRGDLECDLVVFSDTMLVDPEHPAVCMSIRGMIGATLTVEGPERDVHSGAVSGPSPNPILDLTSLLARLHDERGRVTLPGFYDPVTTPEAAERREYAALPIDDPSTWLDQSRTSRLTGEDGFTIPELLWARPALEVITIQGGDIGQLPRAVIPATATAELSIRLVVGQSPNEVGEQLRRWLEREASDLRWDLSLSEVTAQPPYRTPDVPEVQLLADAMAEGFGRDSVGRMGNAGGGPAQLLADSLQAPVVFFGTGLVTDRWHAADERARLDVLKKGAATLAVFWTRLGRDHRRRPASGRGTT